MKILLKKLRRNQDQKRNNLMSDNSTNLKQDLDNKEEVKNLINPIQQQLDRYKLDNSATISAYTAGYISLKRLKELEIVKLEEYRSLFEACLDLKISGMDEQSRYFLNTFNKERIFSLSETEIKAFFIFKFIFKVFF